MPCGLARRVLVRMMRVGVTMMSTWGEKGGQRHQGVCGVNSGGGGIKVWGCSIVELLMGLKDGASPDL